jgi:hypothetical protein
MVTHRHVSMTKVTKMKKKANVKSLLGEVDKEDGGGGDENMAKGELSVVSTDASTKGGGLEVVAKDETEAKEEVEKEEEGYVVLWKPTLSVRLVSHFARYPRNGIPSSMSEHMSFDYETGYYYPIIYLEVCLLHTYQVHGF